MVNKTHVDSLQMLKTYRSNVRPVLAWLAVVTCLTSLELRGSRRSSGEGSKRNGDLHVDDNLVSAVRMKQRLEVKSRRSA